MKARYGQRLRWAQGRFFSEFKNLVARVAVLKEWMHEHQWKVTPRT